MFFSLLSIIAAITLSSHVAFAQNTYIGCYTTRPTSFTTVARTDAGITSTEACASYCAMTSPSTSPTFTYSAYISTSESGSGTAYNCFCSNSPPNYSSITTSSAGNARTQCINTSAYSTFRIKSSFSFDGCYSSAATTSGTIIPVSDGGDCFALCGNSTNVGLAARTDNSACLCDPGIASGAGHTACGSSQVFVFRRTAAAAASGVRKRNEKIVKRQAEKAVQWRNFCPGGRTACKIPGTDSYECLDTMSELESCGGCVTGIYGLDIGRLDTTGVDCSALKGAPLGSYTCSAGKCKASTCRKGFELDGEGICVPKPGVEVGKGIAGRRI